MEMKEQILAIVREHASAEEQGLWEKTLVNVPESLLPEIFSALKQDGSIVSDLTEGLRRKWAAGAAKDVVAWETALQEEAARLNYNNSYV